MYNTLLQCLYIYGVYNASLFKMRCNIVLLDLAMHNDRCSSHFVFAKGNLFLSQLKLVNIFLIMI